MYRRRREFPRKQICGDIPREEPFSIEGTPSFPSVIVGHNARWVICSVGLVLVLRILMRAEWWEVYWWGAVIEKRWCLSLWSCSLRCKLELRWPSVWLCPPITWTNTASIWRSMGIWEASLRRGHTARERRQRSPLRNLNSSPLMVVVALIENRAVLEVD